MPNLYVLGARQRPSLLKHEEEWNLYEAALILEVNPETGEIYVEAGDELTPENMGVLKEAGFNEPSFGSLALRGKSASLEGLRFRGHRRDRPFH